MNAQTLRKRILTMAYKGQSVHVPCALSIADLIAYLCTAFPNDTLVLSKGHGVMALYAALCEQGKLLQEDLDNYFKNGSRLRGLCEADIPGCLVTSGSLGHGLPIAVGMALARKRAGNNKKLFCIVGDGEMNEGSCWEAAAFASHHGLDNLMVIVDHNEFQAMGKTEEIMDMDLSARFSAFGFATGSAAGNDSDDIDRGVRWLINSTQPQALIAFTAKGSGVSFMEGDNTFHYTRLTEETYSKAMEEIDARQAV